MVQSQHKEQFLMYTHTILLQGSDGGNRGNAGQTMLESNNIFEKSSDVLKVKLNFQTLNTVELKQTC